MLAPSVGVGLVAVIYLLFVAVVTGLLAWAFVKGVSKLLAGDRTPRNVARITGPPFVAAIVAGLWFLSSGGGWRAHRQLDNVLASLAATETSEIRSTGSGLGCRLISVRVDSTEASAIAEHDTRVLEAQGWAVQRLIQAAELPQSELQRVYVATRGDSQIEDLPGVFHLRAGCPPGPNFVGNEFRWTAVDAYP